MGDIQAYVENLVLKAEQDAQVGRGSRGDVTILPTLVINNVQYRGKMERSSMLKVIYARFKEATEPLICLTGDIETNECLTNNGGCWQYSNANIISCKDTFRGRVCEYPLVSGVQFKGDGYSHCKANGAGRYKIKNGDCWSKTKNGDTFFACLESQLSDCQCPIDFHGDGKTCHDVDECQEGFDCQYKGC